MDERDRAHLVETADNGGFDGVNAGASDGHATTASERSAKDDIDSGRSLAPTDDTTSPQSGGDEGVRLQVAVTGALLTGHALAIPIHRYGDVQRELAKRLPGMKWQMKGLRSAHGTYESTGGGGFTEAVPLVIARCDGTDYLPWLLAALRDSGAPGVIHVDRFPPVLAAMPTKLLVDIYDLGVAVVTAWFELPQAAIAQPEATARAVKRLVWLRPDDGGRSPVAETLQKIATAITEEYGQAVAAVAPRELESGRWRSGEASRDADRDYDLLQDEYGRLLWLHPVHVVTAPASAEYALRTADATSGATGRVTAKQTVRKFAPTFYETVNVEGGVFAPGIGTSAVVAVKESEARRCR